MSRKTILIDDMEQSGEVLADETLSYAWDGVPYEVDLSAKNATSWRNKMAPLVAASRRAGAAVTKQKATVSRSTSPNREQNDAIREWARQQGKQVSHKGRIPQALVDEFNAAHTHPIVQQPEFSGV